MRRLRIAVLQLALGLEIREALNSVSGLLSNLRRLEPDIALLPEAWISQSPLTDLESARESSEMAINKLCKLAIEHGLFILGGGLYLTRNSKTFVSCPVISDSGEILGFQEKVHLFGPERGLLERGGGFKIFPVKGVNIGIAICHDIVYPESVRTLVLRGAKLLFNPARIISKGVEAWHLYLKVRSLENRTPIYAANVWAPPKYTGGSCIVKPAKFAEDVYLAEKLMVRAGQSLLVDEADVDALDQARRERLSGRVPKAYSETAQGSLGCGEAWV